MFWIGLLIGMGLGAITFVLMILTLDRGSDPNDEELADIRAQELFARLDARQQLTLARFAQDGRNEDF